MYEIQTPEHWEKVSGVIRWPDPEDVDGLMWEMYRSHTRRKLDWHEANKKQWDEGNDPMHLDFEFAVKFTERFGSYDLNGVDLGEWLQKKTAVRVKVVSWLSREVAPYWNKVLDPKG